MTPELPLAAAQRRLGRPGRPRKHAQNGHNSGQAITAAPEPRDTASANGHDSGARVTPTPAVDTAPLAVVTVPLPYSGWKMRDAISAGSRPAL